MTADTARAIASNHGDSKQREDIIKTIRYAAEDGQFSVSFYRISSSNLDWLMSLGYKQSGGTTIHW